ncbi:hypothetical protein SmJEL517_g02939 [Synchytrium microbalum]|uniref:Ribosomal small subunit Rsm22 n=1 Tax=Synchytrium microbalum TaxID=1806994 RepID=A0A507C8H1_9FUNG|nr:uncharacterized protein SmJEL517_g02939 [Synchytrium microbalum]TPX34296.1 hypothetical protein SmJEL517_g02939 [Synchytrium microbalum]
MRRSFSGIPHASVIQTTSSSTDLQAKDPVDVSSSSSISPKRLAIVPSEIHTAIEAILKDSSNKALKDDLAFLDARLYAGQATNARSRELDPSRDIVQYSQRDVMAYVAGRLVGAYVAMNHVLQQLMRRSPDFAPKHILDFGCGPGTAIWCVFGSLSSLPAFAYIMKDDRACREFWNVDKYTAVDSSSVMLKTLEDMSEKLPGSPIAVEKRIPMDAQADLVLCAFTLNEFSDVSSRARIVDSLWKATSDTLVLLESGTPSGFKLTETARAQILQKPDPAHVLAPCPHEYACPMVKSKSWCHFPQKFQLNRRLRLLQNANESWDTVKFSYVILRKGVLPSSLEEARRPVLNAAPMKKHGHVILDYCSTAGQLERTVISKSKGKLEYAAARKSSWGDVQRQFLSESDEEIDLQSSKWRAGDMGTPILTRELYELEFLTNSSSSHGTGPSGQEPDELQEGQGYAAEVALFCQDKKHVTAPPDKCVNASLSTLIAFIQ